MALTIPGAVAGAAPVRRREAVAEPDGARLSYGELDERVTRVAAALIGAAWRPGTGWPCGHPTAYWVLAALGTLGAGGVLVPVSTRFTGPEALDVISRSGATVLFVAVISSGWTGSGRCGRGRGCRIDGGRGALDRLGLVVRTPGDWPAFERRADTVTTAEARTQAGLAEARRASLAEGRPRAGLAEAAAGRAS